MKSIDYIVECPNCGGQNGIKNVVQTLSSLPEEERGKYKRVYIKEEQQESIDTIKNFNLSGYSFADDEDTTSETSTIIGIVIALLVLLVGFSMLLIQSFPR